MVLINKTLVSNFIKTYKTDNLKYFMNICGVNVDNLYAALNYSLPEIYNNFGPVLQLQTYFDCIQTLGIMHGPKEIATQKTSSAFAQQETFNKYAQLAVIIYNNKTTFSISKRVDFDNYTSLTPNGTLPFAYQFGTTFPTIAYSCAHCTLSQGLTLQIITTSATFSDPYAWVQYTSSTVIILDGTPIFCDDSTANTLLYGLSTSDYIYPGNKSIKFDFIQPLAYQTVIAGYIIHVSGTSGTAYMGEAAETQISNNLVSTITNNSTQNIAPTTNSVHSVQVNKNAGYNVDQASDVILKPSLTNREVVSWSDNVGSAAKAATSTGTGTVQTAGDACKPVASNSLVTSTGNNFNGVVAEPTTTLGNTTGGVGYQATNQTALKQLDQQASGSVSVVGDTASNSALNQGGAVVGNAAANQAIGTVGGQTGSVKNSGAFADPAAVQSGVGDVQGAGVPNTTAPVVG